MVMTYERWKLQADKVAQEIRETLEGRGPPTYLDIMNLYQMGLRNADGAVADLPRGKYLRPTLCFLMCSALTCDEKALQVALPAAACLEIIHRASLIFDDIQDNGKVRNNRSTVPALWGNNQSINAGLALSCYARLALQRMRSKGCHDSTILDIMDVLEKTVIRICQGQYMDLQKAGDDPVGDYNVMARHKTGALFGAACEVGALVALNYTVLPGGCWSPEPADVMRREAHEFGELLGLAFQMHDDYLGIWGDESHVGKTSNDLMERKRSLPVALALQGIPGEIVTGSPMKTFAGWLDMDRAVSFEEALHIKEFLERHNIDKIVREMELAIIKRAKNFIFRLSSYMYGLPGSKDGGKGLLDFISSVISRDA